MLAFDFPGLVERIIEREKALGYLHAELARKISVPPSTITNIIYQRQQPRFKHIVAMARELGVSPGWLAFGGPAETMDDEETSIVQAWRKLTADERAAWERMLLATTAARATVKTERVKREKAPADDTATAASDVKPGGARRKSGRPPLPATILAQAQEQMDLMICLVDPKWKGSTHAAKLARLLDQLSALQPHQSPAASQTSDEAAGAADALPAGKSGSRP